MQVITAKNVNEALHEGVGYLKVMGMKRDSRNGPVLRAPGPVVTVYQCPKERLVSHPLRDANNVFHLMESIWMLAGENNVKWLLPFNSKFGQYAREDGVQHGAYGFRWRRHFRYDQLSLLLKELQNPNTRRAVLQMWSCSVDLNVDEADIPCNTHVYFNTASGNLDMTVCCRSNDIVWGAYGANAVHFSILQELLAHALKIPVGKYVQFSNDYHLYLEFGPGAMLMAHLENGFDYDPYFSGTYKTIPLLREGEHFWDFIRDCENFVSQVNPVLRTDFMKRVAHPIRVAYMSRREGDKNWKDLVFTVPGCDWLESFLEWADRRGKHE